MLISSSSAIVFRDREQRSQQEKREALRGFSHSAHAERPAVGQHSAPYLLTWALRGVRAAAAGNGKSIAKASLASKATHHDKGWADGLLPASPSHLIDSFACHSHTVMAAVGACTCRGPGGNALTSNPNETLACVGAQARGEIMQQRPRRSNSNSHHMLIATTPHMHAQEVYSRFQHEALLHPGLGGGDGGAGKRRDASLSLVRNRVRRRTLIVITPFSFHPPTRLLSWS